MASSAQHRRTHNLLLISRLLSLRENISPFTLVLDSLEQSGKPLLSETMRRIHSTKYRIIYISFETIDQPPGVDFFIKATGKSPKALQRDLGSVPLVASRTVIVIDSINYLALKLPTSLPAFLSSLLNPKTSLLAIYHLDVPTSVSTALPYSPHPLILLKYLATTVLSVHSISQILIKKRAADRSLSEPSFGRAEGTEGVLVGLGANDSSGVVVEMEYRRKSGRGSTEWFFLPASASNTGRSKETVILLQDHPLYKAIENVAADSLELLDEDQISSTFSMELSDKQKRDRENVVLPYFDAQKVDGSVGEGGRILYDMGAEDDFDEEEDEI